MSGPGGLPFTVHGHLPTLQSPTLLVMLTGWIDASGAAAAAMEHLVTSTRATEVVSFDPDTFMDYRARRPVMELREGVNTRIVWSTPTLRAGKDRNGSDVLLLNGPEPDSNWRYFADTVGELASQLGVVRMIGLGAYPFGAPHTRSVGLSNSSPSKEIADRLMFTKNSVDVPAGVEAILEHAFHDRGIASMGFWAQIPHYVASMSYPAASAALIDAVNIEAGLDLDATSLRRDADVQRERLDNLVEGNPEHLEMLHKLEAAYDQMHPQNRTELDMPIPSVDELAAEVEQFLRDQQPGGQQ